MNFDLNLTQEQKLIMTQQMQLSIKLLQMSSYELQQYVDKELQENPVIEIKDKEEIKESSEKIINYKELVKFHKFDEYNHENYTNSKENISPFNFLSAQKSLKDFLNEQIGYLNINDIKKSICSYIIGDIDEKGYLVSSVSELVNELNCPINIIEECVKLIQSLEPDGIGARNLKECLKIQLMKKGEKDSRLFLLIDECMELFAEHKFNLISKKMNLNIEKVKQYYDLIKELNPKPSRGFYSGEDIRYIVPDAYIIKYGEEYVIQMNEDANPRLTINSLYENIIMHENDKNTVDYVKEKINNAVFLINSIEKRKITICRILEKLVQYQREYFEYGDKFLKPMTLKQMADWINVHESTVSRAIREKYISTDRGVLGIRQLFTTAIASENDGDYVSSRTIKNTISQLIGSEDKAKPLSDQQLSDILKEKGVNLARRTVAKYREELGLLTSSKRKRT